MSGVIPPMNYIAETTVTFGGSPASTTGGSIPLGHDCINKCSFQNQWNRTGTGTLEGNITYEASNDPRAFPGHEDYDDAIWFDITAEFSPSNPNGSAGDAIDTASGLSYMYIRQKFTSTVGSGSYRSIFSGHGD